MFLSVHIPKTAGTTFGQYLGKLFPNRVCFYYDDQYKSPDFKVLQEIPSSTICIHGHFKANDFLDRYPDAKLITWFRDPVDRLASYYNHILKYPQDARQPAAKRVVHEQLGFLEFARLWSNEIRMWLSEKTVDDFSFIGIQEDFEKSIKTFNNIFDIGRPIMMVPAKVPVTQRIVALFRRAVLVQSLNVASSRRLRASLIDTDTREKIEQYNHEDLLLYNEAKAKLEKLYETLFKRT